MSDMRRDAMLRTAVLAGWAARPLDPQVLTTAQCDTISKAAAGAALDLLAEWRAQATGSTEESVLVELPRDNGFLLVDPAEVCSLWEIDTRLAYENGQLQTQIVLRSGVSLTASIPLADVRAALGI